MDHQGTKVAVVTGANRGIGLAIVRGLCMQFEGDVYLTSRDEMKGRAAVASLEDENLKVKPRFYQLDVSSPESIENLRKYILERYGGIDVLVNNAGVMFKRNSTLSLAEQAITTLEVNFTGTLMVSRAFMPLIRPNGRIVNVSSTACRLSNLGTEDLRQQFSGPDLTEKALTDLTEQFVKDVVAGVHKEKGWPSAYETSKVAVTALTKIHAMELERSGKDILVNCCCPGWVQTGMTSERAALSPDQGAETPLFLALLPSGSPSGEFWRDKKVEDWATTIWPY